MRIPNVSTHHVLPQKVLFAVLIGLACLVQGFFFINMVQWTSAPDRGWVGMTQLGPKIIAVTRPLGEQAGLRKGDKILTINGQSYETFEELVHLLDWTIGHRNVYSVERDGQILTVAVQTQSLGVERVALQSGIYWVLGSIFIGMGVLVFLMKPFHGPSWAFFVMTLLLGITITYFSPSYFYTSPWLGNIVIFSVPLLAAAILHLTVLFPERRPLFADRRSLIVAIYLTSLCLSMYSRLYGQQIGNIPAFLLTIIYLYLLIALGIFLLSTINSYRRTASVAVRLQSLVIFSGIIVALVIPVGELLSNLVFRVSYFPNPIFFYLLFLGFFPLSIGYAIVRHDLFEIDVIVRRTYGYLLSTGTVVGSYVVLVSGLNATFQSSDISGSPLFSILFALAVVFCFEPLHKRIQYFVDRGFYRLHYDYRQTIKRTSEAMTTMLDPTLIQKTLLNTAVKEMFLENGMLFLPKLDQEGFHLVAIEGTDLPSGKDCVLQPEDPVVTQLKANRQAIFRHDIDLQPHYEEVRDDLRDTFDRYDSELIIAMLYKGELHGVVSLGRKKSGKMFTQEDLDLLTTMISQSAIALENARLVDQMKKDLTVRTNLARYLSPQIVDRVMQNTVHLNLGGDRKVVTVLFSDIRNFTTITESRPPDQLVAILNEYFTEMAKLIFANQGSLDKYIGDAIVAVFGSLIPLENSAVHAVRTATHMMEVMPTLNQRWLNLYGFRMDIGIGINTGEVFLGNIGSPERMEFTVIGDVVNVASRFSGLAKPGQILMTRETLAAVGQAVSYRELPPSAVKGKSEKLEVFEVACA